MKSRSKKLIFLMLSLFLIICIAAIGYPWLISQQESSQMPSPSPGAGVEEEKPQDKNDYMAPDFTVFDENGNAVALSSFLGKKPIVLNFWASTCSPCKMEMPDFERAYQKYGDQVEFVMVDAVGLLGETEEKGRSYYKEQNYTFPIYFDRTQDAIITYGLRGVPMTVFIDNTGEMQYIAQGMITSEILEQNIQRLLPND